MIRLMLKKVGQKQDIIQNIQFQFLFLMDKPNSQMMVKKWTMMSDVYVKLDSSPQTFYYTLVNVMKLHEAKNILEVGCGKCLFLPYALQLKPQETPYLASDLTPKMIDHANQYLQGLLTQYESKLSYEQWLNKHNVTIKVANGEQPLNANPKFDRIICNLVLMLANDAEVMLNNLANQAEQGCILGVSIWGDKTHDVAHGFLAKTLEELGIENPKKRTQWHLYQKVGQIGEKAGWQVVLNWEQATIFPFISFEESLMFTKVVVGGLAFLSEEQRQKVAELYYKKLQDLFDAKKPVLFPIEMYILRKK